jgi:DNA end-binding protein Ku
MRPRSIWKGYLKLSLVSCAVALYTASTTSEKIAFKQINRTTGNRVRQQLVDEASREPVDRTDIVRGYEVMKGSFLLIEDEDLETVRIETSNAIDIEQFVPASQIDPVYLDSPYYLAPEDKVSAEPFAVIRAAMVEKGLVGIGRMVLNRRERVMMLMPRGKGLLATALRYPYEVRSDADAFTDIPDVDASAEMLELAGQILDRRTAQFDPSRFEDRYENALVELIKAKQKGQPLVTPEAAPAMPIIDFMEALRRSIQAEAPKTPEKRSKSAKTSDESKPAPRRAKKTATG